MASMIVDNVIKFIRTGEYNRDEDQDYIDRITHGGGASPEEIEEVFSVPNLGYSGSSGWCGSSGLYGSSGWYKTTGTNADDGCYLSGASGSYNNMFISIPKSKCHYCEEDGPYYIPMNEISVCENCFREALNMFDRLHSSVKEQKENNEMDELFHIE